MASPGSVVIQFLVDAKNAARDAAALGKSFVAVDREADGLDSTLSGLESELDSIGRETASLKADMTKAGVGFDGVGDAAETAADKVRRAARDMADGVRDGARGIDHETDGIRSNMADTGREAGAEFIGNVAEGIGSGQANINDVVSGTLGGLTNLVATLGGPVGMAAGAAAAGIGLVFAAVKGESEKAKAALDATRDALDGIADKSGEAAKEALFQKWITEAQQTAGKIENVNAALQDAGVLSEDFKRALAGDPAAMEKVRVLLFKQGQEIIRAQKAGQTLTEDQERFQETMPTILKDLHLQAQSTGAARREWDAIEALSGRAAKNIDEQTQALIDAAQKARELAANLDEATKDRDVRVRVALEGGATMGEALGNYWGRSAPAPASTRAAPAPVTVKVYATGPTIPNSPRALVNLLETHQTRMGRRPGQPRAVAW